MNVKQAEPKHIILCHNQMYLHKIIKFNYTMYDMQQDQDVLNPGTSHCNFMALVQLELDGASDEHPFLYGHVLNVFHMNVIYNSPRMTDYNPQYFDVLWVCWYNLENLSLHKSKTTKPKLSHCLDQLVFPPLDREDSLGFLDPADVLRGCHIIPAFTTGRCFLDSEGLSKWAREDRDWNAYYVAR